MSRLWIIDAWEMGIFFFILVLAKKKNKYMGHNVEVLYIHHHND